MFKLDSLPNITSINGGRRRAVDVHALLRSMIVSGEIPPGTILSQQDLSRLLNVSRTPVREALRKLHEEELIEGEPNIRARAAGFDLDRLEVLYTTRILMEPFAVAMSVPLLDEADILALEGQIACLASARARDDFGFWLGEHRRFHLLLICKCSRAMIAAIEANCERSDRYLHLFHNRHPPGWWMRGDAEHREILRVTAEKDAVRAAKLVALHIGRTALDLASELAPDREPRHLRAALKMTSAQAGFPTPSSVRRSGGTRKLRRLAESGQKKA